MAKVQIKAIVDASLYTKAMDKAIENSSITGVKASDEDIVKDKKLLTFLFSRYLGIVPQAPQPKEEEEEDEEE